MTLKPSRTLRWKKKPYCLLVFEVVCVRLLSIFPLAATSKFVDSVGTLIGRTKRSATGPRVESEQRRSVKEFDHQWRKLASSNIEYTEQRGRELLGFTKLQPSFFKEKLCLDAGCGNGRYTFALLQLGAKVVSIDISEEAIKSCRGVNPNAYVRDLLELSPNPIYDFVLCWGVLHHLSDPSEGFKKIASQVKPDGVLHIMVYHRKTQKLYEEGRKVWPSLDDRGRLNLCRRMVKKYGGDLHGWWDAYNPKYNWSFHSEEVKKWFEEEGFEDIIMTMEYNINMRGRKR